MTILPSFWDGILAAEGDPQEWSEEDLRKWLADPNLSATSRDELLAEMEKRLEKLYSEFKPSYAHNASCIQLSALMAWEDLQQLKEQQPSTSHDTTAADPSVGPVESAFRGCFSDREQFAYGVAGKIPVGLHPLHDLRHNLLAIAKTIDDGDSKNVILQDDPHGNGGNLVLRLLGVKFLPPGEKPVRGGQVVCHNLHNQDAALQQWNGCVGTAQTYADGMFTLHVPKQPGTGAGEEGTAAGEEGTQAIQVPSWALLPVADSSPSGSSFLQAGDPVVLRGLEKTPQLNGRLGQVTSQPITDAAGNTRHVVHLYPLPNHNTHTVRAKPSSLVRVKPPPPAIAVAHTYHDKRTHHLVLNNFLATQGQHIVPATVIKCTPRELAFMKRCVNDNAAMLQALSEQYKKRLLAPLNPHMWKVSMLLPPLPLPDPEAVAHRELRQALTCRHCGKDGKQQTLQWCRGCWGVCYCSQDCVKADWRARHRQECKPAKPTSRSSGRTTRSTPLAPAAPPATPAPPAPPAAPATSAPPVTPAAPAPSRQASRESERARPGPAAGSNPSPSSTPSGTPSSESESSVLLPIDAPPPPGTPACVTSLMDPQRRTMQSGNNLRQNRNVHGDSTFVLKVQVPPSGKGAQQGMPEMPMFCYDQTRGLQFMVYRQSAPRAAYAAVERAVRQRGVMGAKLYVNARREGGNVRVMLDSLPSQQQPW